MTEVRAVCVGINKYPGAPLSCCVRDAEIMTEQIMRRFRWPVRAVRSACGASTASDIRERHEWAIQADFWFLDHSGHGTQAPDRDGDEIDGLDEIFCPIDFDWADRSTWLTDDYYSELFRRAKPGSQGVVIFDSCHSGTMHRSIPPGTPVKGKVRTMPIPPEIREQIRWARAAARPLRYRRVVDTVPKGVTVISACRSDQVSMDWSPVGDPRQGAFHGALFSQMAAHEGDGWADWVTGINAVLGAAGLDQVAQIVTGEGGPTHMLGLG